MLEKSQIKMCNLKTNKSQRKMLKLRSPRKNGDPCSTKSQKRKKELLSLSCNRRRLSEMKVRIRLLESQGLALVKNMSNRKTTLVWTTSAKAKKPMIQMILISFKI